MAPNRIAELSTIISTYTKKVDTYLTDRNLPTPSLNADASAYPVPEDAPSDIKEAATAAAEACSELDALMTGPRELVRFNVSVQARKLCALLKLWQWTAWVSVKAILRFHLDESFPIDGETTF
jgi:hypothetical protein